MPATQPLPEKDDEEGAAATTQKPNALCGIIKDFFRSLPLASVASVVVVWAGWALYKSGTVELENVKVFPDVILKLGHVYSALVLTSAITTLVFGVICTGWTGEQLAGVSSPSTTPTNCQSRTVCMLKKLFCCCNGVLHWGFGILNFVVVIYAQALLIGVVLLTMLLFAMKTSCRLGADGQDAMCTLLKELDNAHDVFDRACVCAGTVTGASCSTGWSATSAMVKFCTNVNTYTDASLNVTIGVFISLAGMVVALCVLLRSRQRMSDLEKIADNEVAALQREEDASRSTGAMHFNVELSGHDEEDQKPPPS